MTNQLLSLLESCGAGRAAAIPGDAVVYNTVFREICAKNSCGIYGKCHMCPPDIGPIDELIAQAKDYPLCILYQNIYEIEDSFDIEGMIEAKKAHHKCAQKVNEALSSLLGSNCLHLEAGGCGVCERCSKLDHLPCRFPHKALSSMEAYCVDVYNTATNAGLKYVNGQNTITYFGMILYTEETHA